MRRPAHPLKDSCLLTSALAALCALSFGVGCYSAGDGVSPPEERIYFPVGLALANEGRHLVVVNSDFDLQYNAGSLAVLDADRLSAYYPRPCNSDADCEREEDSDLEPGKCDLSLSLCSFDGKSACSPLQDRPLADQLIHPGPCAALDPENAAPIDGDGSASLFTDAVRIGAFATDLVYRERPRRIQRAMERALAAGDSRFTSEASLKGRLFIPVRGDRTLHWADLSTEGKIACGQEFASGACDDTHRVGDDPDRENTRDLRLDPEPFAIDATADAEAVLVSNQTSGEVSLFVNCWTTSSVAQPGSTPGSDPIVSPLDPNCLGIGAGPSLQFAVTGLPQRPVGIAALPPPALAAAQPKPPEVDPSSFYYPPGFFVSFRNAPEIDVVRYYSDRVGRVVQPAQGDVLRPYASLVNRAAITINSSGSDSRGIAVDDSARRRAEASCATQAMLDACSAAADCAEVLPSASLSGLAACVSDPLCLEQLPASVKDDALRECLKKAASTQLDVFVANRSPATLLIGRTQPAIYAFQSTENPLFYDNVPLLLGPSRVVLGDVIVGTDANGGAVHERRVFVVAFDSRRIFVYDPARQRMDTEIITGRGPHALAVDAQRGQLYVGHFTDSFIGVVSLDRRFPKTYGKMLTTIGIPSEPRTSK